MSSVWPDQASNDKNSLIGQLLQGRDSAIQLHALLSKASGEDQPAHADEMLEKILSSFKETISAMSSCKSADVSVNHSSGASSESKKRPVSKQARGCYKRRRGSQTSMTVTSTVEDGYAWRKYGQKEIRNSKFPRCYFRCKHKHDQGCKANKQVQKVEDNPNMYQITYLDQHSCGEIVSPVSDPCESNVPRTCRKSKHQICDPNNQSINPFQCAKDEHKDGSMSVLMDCISGFNHGFPDLPGFGSSLERTMDFSIWSFSDDGFVLDFLDMDFMNSYINFGGHC